MTLPIVHCKTDQKAGDKNGRFRKKSRKLFGRKENQQLIGQQRLIGQIKRSTASRDYVRRALVLVRQGPSGRTLTCSLPVGK